MKYKFSAKIRTICRYYTILALFCTIVLIYGCGTKSSGDKDRKTESDNKQNKEYTTDTLNNNSSLKFYGLDSDPPKVLSLPSVLSEISGITFTADERLFAHGDEYADIYELDKESGKIIKKFSLGNLLAVKGDFEDIAFANGKFYTVDSKGKLFEFKEGSNGSFVDYKTYKTGLNESNNVEGLCYDPVTNSLLLACKDNPGTEKKKEKAVYSFSLDKFETAGEPRFIISEKKVSESSEEKNFSPSGISLNPLTKTFYIIASKGNIIIEVSPDGNILGTSELPGSIHRQAEGIAFTKDGTLYISNEASGKTPVIVIYPVKK
jgi:uncharacterized protein YjiK